MRIEPNSSKNCYKKGLGWISMASKKYEKLGLIPKAVMSNNFKNFILIFKIFIKYYID